MFLRGRSLPTELHDGVADEVVMVGYSYGASWQRSDRAATSWCRRSNEAFVKALAVEKRCAGGWFQSHSDIERTTYSGVRSPSLQPQYSSLRSRG